MYIHNYFEILRKCMVIKHNRIYLFLSVMLFVFIKLLKLLWKKKISNLKILDDFCDRPRRASPHFFEFGFRPINTLIRIIDSLNNWPFWFYNGCGCCKTINLLKASIYIIGTSKCMGGMWNPFSAVGLLLKILTKLGGKLAAKGKNLIVS